MASYPLISLLTLSILLQTTLSAPTCSPYTTCNTLPTFKSTLHYTYTPSNSTLSVAFTATPPSPSGWVAWGINPTATGMIGTQAFVAFKSPSDGSVTVSTFNLSSYADIIPTKPSFPVYDKRAVFNSADGSFTIYAVVKSEAGKVNHVWQVGPGVTPSGLPKKHDIKPDNLASKTTIDLSSSSSSSTTTKAGTAKSSAADFGFKKSHLGSLAMLVLFLSLFLGS